MTQLNLGVGRATRVLPELPFGYDPANQRNRSLSEAHGHFAEKEWLAHTNEKTAKIDCSIENQSLRLRDTSGPICTKMWCVAWRY